MYLCWIDQQQLFRSVKNVEKRGINFIENRKLPRKARLFVVEVVKMDNNNCPLWHSILPRYSISYGQENLGGGV